MFWELLQKFRRPKDLLGCPRLLLGSILELGAVKTVQSNLAERNPVKRCQESEPALISVIFLFLLPPCSIFFLNVAKGNFGKFGDEPMLACGLSVGCHIGFCSTYSQ